jgi:hypothetical protein
MNFIHRNVFQPLYPIHNFCFFDYVIIEWSTLILVIVRIQYVYSQQVFSFEYPNNRSLFKNMYVLIEAVT